MKLITLLLLFIFSTHCFAYLIPNPAVEFDQEMLGDPTRKRALILKYTGDYYKAYLNEFQQINSVDLDPFIPGLEEEIFKYFQKLPSEEIDNMNLDQVKVFMREQLADQLYIPLAKDHVKVLLKDSEELLRETTDKVEKIEKELLMMAKDDKKVKIGSSGTTVSVDSLYLATMALLTFLILILLQGGKAKAAKGSK